MTCVNVILVSLHTFLLTLAAIFALSMWYNRRSHNIYCKLTQINNTVTMDWANLATGTSGDLALERAWLRKVQEVYGIFCVKQHDYGPNNIAVGGLKGVIVRMGDKMSRLFELGGISGDKEPAVKSEGLRDTLIDEADYGIIGLLVVDGDWELKDPRDVWGSNKAE